MRLRVSVCAKHRAAPAALVLVVAACSGSTAPAMHPKTWKAWVKTFCGTQYELRTITDAATVIPDSRSFHIENRLYPAMYARSTTEASDMRTRAIDTLESVAAKYRAASARVHAAGPPTSPSILNGGRLAERYEHSQTVVASELERLVPVARRLPVEDLKQFQTAFDALRIEALHALETADHDFGQAPTIATGPELEKIMRQDGNCYWLGD